MKLKVNFEPFLMKKVSLKYENISHWNYNLPYCNDKNYNYWAIEHYWNFTSKFCSEEIRTEFTSTSWFPFWTVIDGSLYFYSVSQVGRINFMNFFHFLYCFIEIIEKYQSGLILHNKRNYKTMTEKMLEKKDDSNKKKLNFWGSSKNITESCQSFLFFQLCLFSEIFTILTLYVELLSDHPVFSNLGCESKLHTIVCKLQYIFKFSYACGYNESA